MSEAFSAALCRGLIEADTAGPTTTETVRSFPRLYAAASLKHAVLDRRTRPDACVFRGFMPRPH